MVDKNKEVTQLAERIDSQSAVALTDKQKLSLYKKSQKSGYPIDILEEVYSRGIESWTEETNKTPEQYAFGRVNSFIAGGKAMELDEDLLNESTEALKKKSASSGISTAILRQVYKRGVAAWRTVIDREQLRSNGEWLESIHSSLVVRLAAPQTKTFGQSTKEKLLKKNLI